MKHPFLTRLATLNAPFFAKELRKLADMIELLWPGTPVVAAPVIFSKGGHLYMGVITVPDSSEPLGASVTFLDAKGAQTSAEDVPVWTTSDSAVADLNVADDGLSAIATIGTPGASLIEVSSTTADGDVIVAQGTITVTPGEPASGSVDFTPTP